MFDSALGTISFDNLTVTITITATVAFPTKVDTIMLYDAVRRVVKSLLPP
jgi:hypothetical protein